jgi:1-acyl-sn-glycerol-3-phosphate acyltransferase
MRRREGMSEVRVQGLENLRQAIDRGDGVLITSNHVGHADPFIFLVAGDQLGVPFYYMMAWQSFYLLRPHERFVLQRHGAFSVDRESNDFRAFRQSVDILQRYRNPLVMFPEGEIYHNCQWVAPFRTGTAGIALTAAKGAKRRIVGIPAAIRYEYINDPTPKLNPVIDALEKRLLWQPRPDLPMGQRLYRLADAVVSLRELGYLGAVQHGTFTQRTLGLAETILDRIEDHYQISSKESTIPERVTAIRRQAIGLRESLTDNDPQAAEVDRQMEDLCIAIQLYSYSEDYNSDHPSMAHLAEIVDKFEEDILGAPTATVHGGRRSTIAFGRPLEIKPTKKFKEEVPELTTILHHNVRELLATIEMPGDRQPADTGWGFGLRHENASLRRQLVP